MTCRGESRKESSTPKILLSTRTTLSLGTWNVRTMFETGKSAQVASEMRNYRLAILGLSETRWTKSGESRLRTGQLLLYSGHEEDGAPHTEGVGFMLGKEAQRALIGWEARGPKLITASFTTKEKRIKMNIVQCYAPTNDSEEEQKEAFYNQLQDILKDLNRKDVNIVMGDFNAKVGSYNTGLQEIIGTHALGQMNANGELFSDMCAMHGLVIGGSIFPHKRIHKATWVSPDHVTENQIDHLCINRTFRRSLQDVCVKRGADVASDHHLLVAKLKLKLKKNHIVQERRRARFNVGFLKDENTKQEFKIQLCNRFQALQQQEEEEEPTVNSQWLAFKEVVNRSCEETLGRRKPQQGEWISMETLRKVEERRQKKAEISISRTRAAKAAATEAHTEANREVKRSARADKRRYIDSLAQDAEDAAGSGNMKKLYEITRKLSEKPSQNERPVKDKNGNSLLDKEEQLRRWVEHFGELLNRPLTVDPPDIQEAEEDLPIECGKPTREEIRKAILKLRSGKAAGPDEIPAEALKADMDTMVSMLKKLFDQVWDTEEIPEDWKEGHLIKIPKKGDLSNCSNYRGITLLSIPGKVFNRIILERLKGPVDKTLREEQAGFRQGRSCIDQIATLRIIIEQSIEWNSSLYVNFIDYEKAFDSVDRETLWKLLRHYGIPIKLVTMVKKSYEDMSCRVVHGGRLSERFWMRTGVRQGCLLSPFLFLLAIDWIMKTSTQGRRNGIQWTLLTQLEDLDFADDLALLSHTRQQMQMKTTELAANSAKLGLNIHKGKTKVLKVNTNSQEPVTIGGEDLQEVDSFTYLGSMMDNKGGTDADIKSRIGKARVVFRQLRKLWSSRLIGRQTKIRLFNTNVKTVLLYGAETWRTTKTAMNKVQTFINGCLRRILNIHWPETINNQELWERTSQRPVESEILKRRWGWLGHTLRRPSTSYIRQSLTWNPQGKRKRGRPRNTWRRDLQQDVKRLGCGWNQLERIAQDRRRWRDVVDGLCSRRGDGP